MERRPEDGGCGEDDDERDDGEGEMRAGGERGREENAGHDARSGMSISGLSGMVRGYPRVIVIAMRVIQGYPSPSRHLSLRLGRPTPEQSPRKAALQGPAADGMPTLAGGAQARSLSPAHAENVSQKFARRMRLPEIACACLRLPALSVAFYRCRLPSTSTRSSMPSMLAVPPTLKHVPASYTSPATALQQNIIRDPRPCTLIHRKTAVLVLDGTVCS